MNAMLTMNKLSRNDLLSLEFYSANRKTFRARAIAHRKARQLALGAHMTLQFEDRLTIQYQIQEMLRIERIFEAAGIQDELDAYNPLIPDGTNLKATMMLEYPDPTIRAQRLSQLAGIEHKVYAEVVGHSKSYAFADEDMDRSTDDKTSAVHFLRFELAAEMINALNAGATVYFGIDDPRMPIHLNIDDSLRKALMADFRTN